MVINEKALVRQVKEAYKTYGYTVAVDEDTVYLDHLQEISWIKE